MPAEASTTSTAFATRLVGRIAALQSEGDAFYADGLFPSQRTHRLFRKDVEDNTIFFTALVLYILQDVRDALPEPYRARIDEMLRKGRATYPRYLNNQGYPMYNFWQIHPDEQFFPNGKFCSRFRHFRIPEDADTTSYLYLTKPHTAEQARWYKERLILDTNSNRRQIRNTLSHYRSLKSYTTWLGEVNMPLEFDVCVLSNVMLFVFKYGLPLNEYDHNTIRFIRSVFLAREYVSHPFIMAPWYANPTVVLYHLARLIGTYDVPGLSDCRDQLVEELFRQADRATSFMERLLLSTSLMRLDEPPIVIVYPEDWEAQADAFHFVIGGIITSLDNPFTWPLAKLDLFHFKYRCKAHTLALVLEHEVFRQEAMEQETPK